MEDKELIKIVSQYKKGFLGDSTSESKCLMISLPLKSYLQICGIETELLHFEVNIADNTWDHYCLMLPDKRILDATADQFGNGMPGVYLGEMPKFYKKL